jgi:hypothetical protein
MPTTISTLEDDSETVSTIVTSTSMNDNFTKEFENDKMKTDCEEDSPYTIQNSIQIAMERWINVTPISPDKFLANLLISRGYDTTLTSSQALRNAVGPPSDKQIMDYDQNILFAVRNSDLQSLQSLFKSGRRLVRF